MPYFTIPCLPSIKHKQGKLTRSRSALAGWPPKAAADRIPPPAEHRAAARESEPCKQIRCSSGSTASATRQHRGDRAQWAGIAAARRTSATVGTTGSGRKTATCKVPAAEECRELRKAKAQLFGDFFAPTILTLRINSACLTGCI